MPTILCFSLLTLLIWTSIPVAEAQQPLKLARLVSCNS